MHKAMDATELEALANDLAGSARTLASYLQGSVGPSANAPPIPLDAPANVQQARRNALKNALKIQTLLAEPAGMVQYLAVQTQMVACMQWLGNYQILACIPQTGSVCIQDVALLCTVDKVQLSRVIRMTATAGFLHETAPGHVAHTPSSALFVSKPSLGDAAMFLAERANPAALHMAQSMRDVQPSAHAFVHACEQRPRLKRQWAAYLQHVACGLPATDHHAADVLSRLDWTNLGEACVVDVGASSAHFATVLADVHQNLRVVVQISVGDSASSKLAHHSPSATAASNGRITVQTRMVGALQTVPEAAVYILRLPATATTTAPPQSPTESSMTARAAAELRAHLAVLAANSRTSLIVIPHRLLPEPGTVDADVEAAARMRDLCFFQLTNERELERSELVELISGTGNDIGHLHVVGEMRARNNVLVALGVKFQPYQLNAKPLQATF
ncbi:hypothetical protein K491DRAFT_722525 [Lophiostoma macrostomum CBS 122681]|uniref:O-methyltransferase domain-containing protein n=1 Tax=Lophiostoma macrostomum CBS 122681 TaxID=1314788 RepID=A0A6A6SKV1_9PLEO|nr:hypothetical protein K491DRAFT_722525 [Lophiostoma macrostomum CBS 122681]